MTGPASNLTPLVMSDGFKVLSALCEHSRLQREVVPSCWKQTLALTFLPSVLSWTFPAVPIRTLPSSVDTTREDFVKFPFQNFFTRECSFDRAVPGHWLPFWRVRNACFLIFPWMKIWHNLEIPQVYFSLLIVTQA